MFNLSLLFYFLFLNFVALPAQIYLITNSFGDRQAYGGRCGDFVILFRVRLLNEKICQSVTYPLKFPENAQPISKQNQL
jgi:hypothetical protein